MITVMSYYFWSDWTDSKKYEIDESTIWGIELHYRINSWHAVVVTKEKRENGGYVTYELSHQLQEGEAGKLLFNPAITILKIINYHSSGEFIQKLKLEMDSACK